PPAAPALERAALRRRVRARPRRRLGRRSRRRRRRALLRDPRRAVGRAHGRRRPGGRAPRRRALLPAGARGHARGRASLGTPLTKREYHDAGARRLIAYRTSTVVAVEGPPSSPSRSFANAPAP